MHQKKLHLFLIFINLELSTFKLYNLIMCNLYTKFVKFLEICNHFSHDLVTEPSENRFDFRRFFVIFASNKSG